MVDELALRRLRTENDCKNITPAQLLELIHDDVRAKDKPPVILLAIVVSENDEGNYEREYYRCGVTLYTEHVHYALAAKHTLEEMDSW